MSEELSPDPDPDGWNRFEHAVDAALHSAPKHNESKERAEAKKDRKTG
jgi:hypothetical protein